MSTRQTLREFLSSRGASAVDAISITIDSGAGPEASFDEGDDLGVEPQTGKELLDYRTSNSLLTDYASYITEPNMFPIAGGVRVAEPSRRGSNLVTPENSSARIVYAPSSTDGLDRSNSQQFDNAGVPLSTIVDKLGSGTAPDGNQLLNAVVSAEANADSAPNQSKAVIGAFASLRRYNNIAPTGEIPEFVEPYTTTSDFSSNSQVRIQTGKGVYEPQTVEVSADISQQDLTLIARSMMLKAAGWDTTQSIDGSYNPDSMVNRASVSDLSNFPNIDDTNTQGPDPYRARDAYGMPANSTGDSILDGHGDVLARSSEESRYSRSYGAPDTPEFPYLDDPSATRNNRIQALQASIAIMGMACLLDQSFTSIETYVNELQIKFDNKNPHSNDNVLRGPYFLGTSVKSDVTARVRAWTRTFTAQTGIYSYRACVGEALYGLFGISFDSLNTTDGYKVNTTSIARSYGAVITNLANNTGNETNFYLSPMGMSYGFWRSVSESVIRSISNLQAAAVSGNASDFVSAISRLSNSLAIKILNVFAQIGYQRLVIQTIPSDPTAPGRGDGEMTNPWGIDDYPNAPGTRQMKSRDGVLSKTSLAWRNSALPSMFILPVEAMAATLDLDYMFDKEVGANPIKGMLGSTLADKVYVNATRNSNMIPAAVAKRLEDRLGAEYLPFYFRDLRTNEIIAFHGFLESITDQFSPNNASTTGFGRADGVRNYSSTKRTLGGSFWIVATSMEDFDEMWFKINKLTTLAYPQYTRGRSVKAVDNSDIIGGLLGKNREVVFEQPFSQLVGGTPVVRMRIGDLVKSNYSRSNFAKLFGAGNDTFYTQYSKESPIGGVLNFVSKVLPKDAKDFDIRLAPFLVYAASPMELSKLTGYGSRGETAQAGLDTLAEVLGDIAAYGLKNGFVNPFLYNESQLSPVNDALGGVTSFIKKNLKLTTAGTTLLKARSTPYIIKDDQDNIRYLRLHRPIVVKLGAPVDNKSGDAYNVTIADSTVQSLMNMKLIASISDLYIDTGSIVDIGSTPGILLSLGLITGAVGIGAAAASSYLSSAFPDSVEGPVDIPLGDAIGSAARTFTSPIYNPITRAMEDRMGEGLAGVFTSLSFSWMEAPWETDWNGRAPMACKVQFGFDPIHDISPGLDSNGFNRAPIYNVGQIMHDSFGQPRRDGGTAARYFYKRGGAVAEKSKNPETKILGSG